jgi:ATP-dependent DNA helicase RecQ
MLAGLLEKDIEQFGVLHITDKGRAYLESPYPVEILKDHDFTNAESDFEADEEQAASAGCDERLYEMLKALRKKIAKDKGLPPYVVFTDPSLEEMATVYPTQESDLTQITGVGMGKAVKFGKPFLELIKKYVEENDIETASDVVVKTAGVKSKAKANIIKKIDLQVDLEEIAEGEGMNLNDLLTEIEHICYSGTKLNLNYYVNRILDREHQEEIVEYFMSTEVDDLSQALAELGEDYSEDELRVMRIKWLSEVAN